MAGAEAFSVTIVRRGDGMYEARNQRGDVVTFGDKTFTVEEMFLAAVAGSLAHDVDAVTSRRSEPDVFEATATAAEVKDGGGTVSTTSR
jgi:hypothetical protein